MTVVILGEAERDFAESVAYYESKGTGLGWRFRTEVVEAIGWIEANPKLPPSESERIPASQSASISALHCLRHSR